MHLIYDCHNGFRKGELWLGNIKAAKNFTLLKEKHIKFILTVAEGLKIEYPESLELTHKVLS